MAETTKHPAIERRNTAINNRVKAYALMSHTWDEGRSSQQEALLIGAGKFVVQLGKELVNPELEYDIGRAIAALDKIGAALFDLEVAFQLSNSSE
jgi:hypothetical protein